MLSERKGLLESNETIIQKLNSMNKSYESFEGGIEKVNSALNQSLNDITKLEFNHKADVDRCEVKLRLLEETSTKRNDKYNVLVKE